MNRKAIALLSGGLDSTLAVKMMIDQGIDMTAAHVPAASYDKPDRTGKWIGRSHFETLVRLAFQSHPSGAGGRRGSGKAPGHVRKDQEAAVRFSRAKLGVKDYPCPAGGCLLTETG